MERAPGVGPRVREEIRDHAAVSPDPATVVIYAYTPEQAQALRMLVASG